MIKLIKRKIFLLVYKCKIGRFWPDNKRREGYFIECYHRLTGRNNYSLYRPLPKSKTRDYAVVAQIIDFNNWKRGE